MSFLRFSNSDIQPQNGNQQKQLKMMDKTTTAPSSVKTGRGALKTNKQAKIKPTGEVKYQKANDC